MVRDDTCNSGPWLDVLFWRSVWLSWSRTTFTPLRSRGLPCLIHWELASQAWLSRSACRVACHKWWPLLRIAATFVIVSRDQIAMDFRVSGCPHSPIAHRLGFALE